MAKHDAAQSINDSMCHSHEIYAVIFYDDHGCWLSQQTNKKMKDLFKC